MTDGYDLSKPWSQWKLDEFQAYLDAMAINGVVIHSMAHELLARSKRYLEALEKIVVQESPEDMYNVAKEELTRKS